MRTERKAQREHARAVRATRARFAVQFEKAFENGVTVGIDYEKNRVQQSTANLKYEEGASS